jgi:hypothetical protein
MVLKPHRLILGDLHQVYSGRQDPSEKQVTSPQFLLVEKCILFRFPDSVNSVKYRQGTNLGPELTYPHMTRNTQARLCAGTSSYWYRFGIINRDNPSRLLDLKGVWGL